MVFFPNQDIAIPKKKNKDFWHFVDGNFFASVRLNFWYFIGDR